MLGELGLSDGVDITIVAGLLWAALAWFRHSRARLALIGLSALVGLYLVARGLDLQLTTWLFQGFFAVAALMLVVVFQDDLRRLFEGIAVWGLRRGAPRPPPDVERALVRVCFRLAKAKIGALLVLPGREPLERHLEGGVYLNGRLSEPLLLSLFDPSSAGHDGAVVVQANRVIRFGVHLPLSTDRDGLGQSGTRHAAALGLAERSDAFCLVVSEERGSVSIAHAARLERVSAPEELAAQLRRFIAHAAVDVGRRGPRAWLFRAGAHWREGVLALGLAAGLWSIAVPGAALQSTEQLVPVVVENLPDGYELVSVEPAEVYVRFEGRRRDLYMARAVDLSVSVDALLAQLGRRTFELSLGNVQHPSRVDPVAIEPGKVRISVRKP
jgi:uncharacterized protein (TIGR00159 family)